MTLKNAAIAVSALVIVFILLSFWSELRSARSRDLRNVFQSRETSAASRPVERDPFAIVQEGSIHGWPEADSNAAIAASSTTPDHRQQNAERRKSPLGGGQRITISGGRNGVQMDVEPAPSPASTQT